MVFISYSSKDLVAAQELHNYLRNAGIDCWMAPNDIPPGSDYGKSIPQAISNCDAFVLLLSSASQSSVWCPKELDWAISCNTLIIPLHIDSSALTDGFRFSLINVQVLPALHNRESAYKALVSTIKALSKPAAPEQTTGAKTDAMVEQAVREDAFTMDGDALFDLGMDYYYGRGVPKDFERALLLVQKATRTSLSEQNRDKTESMIPTMNYWVGRQYASRYDESVKGGEPDEGLASYAVSYYRKAHELGSLWGTCELGRCFRDGKGVDRDQHEAIRLAKLAAEQGDNGGSLDMGVYYRDGNGIPQDFEKAVYYFAEGAKDTNASPYNRSVSKYFEATTRRSMGNLEQAFKAAQEAKSYAETAKDQGNDYGILNTINQLIAKIELDIRING